MKVWTGLRKTVIKREWQLVEVSFERIAQLRSVMEYLEWFDNTESSGRYAIFSVPFGNEYWFEDPKTATEFVLRFQ